MYLRFQETKTVDENWIHFYSGLDVVNRFWRRKNQPFNYPIGISFWVAKGILLIEILEKGKTIPGQYYTTLLDKQKAAIQEKHPGFIQKNWCFPRQCSRFETIDRFRNFKHFWFRKGWKGIGIRFLGRYRDFSKWFSWKRKHYYWKILNTFEQTESNNSGRKSRNYLEKSILTR